MRGRVGWVLGVVIGIGLVDIIISNDNYPFLCSCPQYGQKMASGGIPRLQLIQHLISCCFGGGCGYCGNGHKANPKEVSSAVVPLKINAKEIINKTNGKTK